MSDEDARTLLDVRGLAKRYPIQKGFLRRVVGHTDAVKEVSFRLQEGETLGLVGESGCGKSTVAKTILRAVDPTAGEVVYRGDGSTVDVATAKKAQLREIRQDIQMVFQDPFSSLSPRQRVRDIIGEPLVVNGAARGKELESRVSELLEAVGLRKEHGVRYPHAFSGGQRQRISIARALALQPRIIICDEPVSALDASVQAQILNLFRKLQESLGLTYLFISHDLGVVQHLSDRVAVMYLGKLVEVASARELFQQPLHPYTEALLLAVPKPHPRHRGTMRVLSGETSQNVEGAPGCPFRWRCPHAQERCAEEDPPLRQIGNRQVACHFSEELSLSGTMGSGQVGRE